MESICAQMAYLIADSDMYKGQLTVYIETIMRKLQRTHTGGRYFSGVDRFFGILYLVALLIQNVPVSDRNWDVFLCLSEICRSVRCTFAGSCRKVWSGTEKRIIFAIENRENRLHLSIEQALCIRFALSLQRQKGRATGETKILSTLNSHLSTKKRFSINNKKGKEL